MYTLQPDFSFPGGVPPTPHQLHPSVVDKLDPVYKQFYADKLSTNSNILYTHRVPLAQLKAAGNVVPGQTPMAEMEKIYDIAIPRKYTEGPEIPARVFVPKGTPPAAGFPCYVWYHGGGHVLGNIGTENSYCSHIAEDAQCVVVTVDYRLAPEAPFPAAPNDAFEALVWALEEGPAQLKIDGDKVAVGGSSAGGNLAAIVCHKFVNSPLSERLPSIKFQVLVVPVTDCTANTDNYESWKEYEFTPQLPAEKMLWYRAIYLPNGEFTDPEASPLFYPDESFKKNPPAVLCVGECDVLKSEGLAYGDKLRRNGVECTANIYKGCPHPVMVMDSVLEQGKQLIKSNVDGLKKAFA
ncbi:uncharacterized protein CANTADRAFT_55350 [Suhomyces tanzawaensis NRRL Y-17324]|uniref:Alpha/beta hydrolase fold-3 domain-containing protein n=1 Tax=Suhomyces tanzawaensis NRRL Y-17324 TaxID=984487 RepID=A0A1E4SE59_9ASCO|nr:uncharacterized protein CANTADRAFT_55350 [Suhomyces tanzawaensis NRRL Y-17324]ODV77773.1 hypothetical protein CANTADRAFT_55350 [Suhomyces tanzawaensis NRRL Y-17324]